MRRLSLKPNFRDIRYFLDEVSKSVNSPTEAEEKLRPFFNSIRSVTIYAFTGFSDATVAKRTFITLKLLQKSVSYFSSCQMIILSFYIFESFAYGM